MAAPILAAIWRLSKGLPLALISPLFLLLTAVVLAACDLVRLLVPKKGTTPSRKPNTHSASIVIPNWNGKDLLERYLPSVIEAAARIPATEVIVVDNGSTDGSAAFVREHFPSVTLLANPHNLGFGQGSNQGFQAAQNDVVVLLNNDMRVEPDFLAPLLAGFTDENVFAVACQIFFSDPSKAREETGLTQFWWRQGALRVRHRNDPLIERLYPCAYPGGGSSAYDRRKFLELGGFDHLLAPFYLEDTDLGYLAWKRGWKCLYTPTSVVYHEHRGTIGKRFSEDYIQNILRKNFSLFIWKNIHEWRRLVSHFFFAWAESMMSWLFGQSPSRATFSGIARAFIQLPGACRARWKAQALANISDTEAFQRPLGGHFRDTFVPLEKSPKRLRVLFVSPYPICPPTHGGGVFMYQTVRQLAERCELHCIVMLDQESDRLAHAHLDAICASNEYFVRQGGKRRSPGTITPHAIREFRDEDLAWAIHRQIYQRKIDVLQLEYTTLGQYAGEFRRIPSILFEHDIYFQSIARRLTFLDNTADRISASWEYLRALRYELRLLPKLDRIQVCSRDNANYLLSFLPELKGRIDSGYRAGINPSDYRCTIQGREPRTMLFLGSFRHAPNLEALDWFVKNVFPMVLADMPDSRLVVVGSAAPPRHSLPRSESIDLIGFVEDIHEPLSRYALFLCPILSGSGVRVKLLEAFASGIPVVSTHLGAEGLADKDGEICALADDPREFAARVIHFLRNPMEGTEMAARAREHIMHEHDIRRMTDQMVACYREEMERMRPN